jgi:hypothetical protein
MKKVVFLIGMVMGLSFGSFGQYDVVTVSSENDMDQFDTWYQIKGEVGMYYFFGEFDDPMMNDYVVEYLEYMGSKLDKYTRIEKDGKFINYVYEELSGDGTNSDIVICYSEEDNTIMILKSEY